MRKYCQVRVQGEETCESECLHSAQIKCVCKETCESQNRNQGGAEVEVVCGRRLWWWATATGTWAWA